jgi:hypothetical protein
MACNLRKLMFKVTKTCPAPRGHGRP